MKSALADVCACGYAQLLACTLKKGCAVAAAAPTHAETRSCECLRQEGMQKLRMLLHDLARTPRRRGGALRCRPGCHHGRRGHCRQWTDRGAPPGPAPTAPKRIHQCHECPPHRLFWSLQRKTLQPHNAVAAAANPPCIQGQTAVLAARPRTPQARRLAWRGPGPRVTPWALPACTGPCQLTASCLERGWSQRDVTVAATLILRDNPAAPPSPMDALANRQDFPSKHLQSESSYEQLTQRQAARLEAGVVSTVSEAATRMLSGRRSPCTTPALCSWRTAASTPRLTSPVLGAAHSCSPGALLARASD